MKNTRTLIMTALTAVMLTAAGCSSKGTEAPKAETKIETTAPDAETGQEEATEGAAANQGEENLFKGTLEENKGFMFTVISEADKEAYVFNLSDEKMLDGIKAGDKIVITYTGEVPKLAEATDTVVVKVEKQ